MKIVLFENFASERGVTTSILNLANALVEHLGAQVAYSYSVMHEKSNNEVVLEAIKSKFPVIPFESQRAFDQMAGREGYEYFYSQKSGQLDFAFSKELRNLNHAVFQVFEPHGHRYAYVSKFLSETIKLKVKSTSVHRLASSLASGTKLMLASHSKATPMDILEQYTSCENPYEFEHVPLVVPPHGDPDRNLRDELGIPRDSYVIGSLSGPGEFNIPFVRKSISQFLDENRDAYFLGPNISKFTSNDRALWLPKITSRTKKQYYLNTLDVFVHARERGETFGLAVAEALSAGKPVLSWSGGIDKHHVYLLRDTLGLYSTPEEFWSILQMFRESPPSKEHQRSLVSQFSPDLVASTFRSVFIE